MLFCSKALPYLNHNSSAHHIEW